MVQCKNVPPALAHFELPGLHFLLNPDNMGFFLPLQILLSLEDKRQIVHLRPNDSYILLPWATQISVPEERPVIIICRFGASDLE